MARKVTKIFINFSPVFFKVNAIPNVCNSICMLYRPLVDMKRYPENGYFWSEPLKLECAEGLLTQSKKSLKNRTCNNGRLAIDQMIQKAKSGEKIDANLLDFPDITQTQPQSLFDAAEKKGYHQVADDKFAFDKKSE